LTIKPEKTVLGMKCHCSCAQKDTGQGKYYNEIILIRVCGSFKVAHCDDDCVNNEQQSTYSC
jgi:hypothetical protein